MPPLFVHCLFGNEGGGLNACQDDLGQKCSEILLTAFVIYVWKSQLFVTTRKNISFVILQESKNTAQMCWDAIVAFNNEWQVGTRLKILIFGECNFST